MKRAQLSGAKKRKKALENENRIAESLSKTKKMTDFFAGPSSVENSSNSSQSISETTNDNVVIAALTDGTNNTVDGMPLSNSDDSVDHQSKSEPSLIFTNNVNQENDPGLWDIFSHFDIEYWLSIGPESCQHHKGPFEKSKRTFGSVARYCNENMFVGHKVNGEKYIRDWLIYSKSTGAVYCFVCKLFGNEKSSTFAKPTGFSDWRNPKLIESHENSPYHRNALLTYLTRRQNVGLKIGFENQINEEVHYWEHVLERVVAVICTLAERGLAFRGAEEKFGSPHNGNFLGLLELISQFDPFLANHIRKYGNAGKGNVSYLSKTICEELIKIMAETVHSEIISQIKKSGYYSISVDSTPDITHTDQLSVVIRYLHYGQPIERFLTFIDLQKRHTGVELAKQTLEYLTKQCNLDFAKCRGQSYDNAANMSGRYNGMQQKIKEVNPLAIYIPCAAHSLNLVGRSAVDDCVCAVNFFSLVQTLYNFFSASTYRWQILKTHLKNENLLKSLADTRWEAHAKATSAISEAFTKIIDALDEITDDDTQKGESRREAGNLSQKMQELEFVVMLEMWDEILKNFNRTSQSLQKVDVTLETCACLYASLVDFLNTLRDGFEEIESRAKVKLPDVEYKITRQRRRRNMPNDGLAAEVNLSPRDQLKVTGFYQIIDKLTFEMRRRGDVYKDIARKFSFLTKIPDFNSISHTEQTAEYKKKCALLREAYPDDLGSELESEIVQFHSYVVHRIRSSSTDSGITTPNLSHQELYNIINDDNLDSAFPNVGTALRIFLCTMISNCTAERSFSKLKILKNERRATMTQERLDSLSIMYIESDLLRKINYSQVIKKFAILKSRKSKMYLDDI